MSLLAIALVVVANVSLPSTPVGIKLAAWLSAIDGRDDAKLRALHAGEADAEQHVAQDRSMRENTGGLDIVRLDRASDTEIDATAKARATDAWIRLHFAVDAKPPHAIVAIGMRPGQAPDELVPRDKLDDGAIAKELEAFVDKLAKAGRFSGAVLVARNGKPVLEKAWGLASRAWNAPNRVDTKLNLGSMNKMFTAVAIGQLVEAGKVKLDDTVGKYLPDFANADVRDKVMVRHLLSHTSGLGSFFGAKFDERKLAIREVRDYLPLIAEEKLAFEPGAKWSYSNSGFVLLGAIIEKASGESYYDYIRKHVYAPAGMKDTDCYDVDRDIPNLASGYAKDDAGEWRTNIFMHVVRGGPAGGGYSTVGDLVRFASALQGGKLVSPPMAKELTTGKVDAQMGKYGFGFGDATVRGHRIVSHSGGFAGISSNLDIYWDDGWTVAVMANVDMGAMPVVAKARELIAR